MTRLGIAAVGYLFIVSSASRAQEAPPAPEVPLGKGSYIQGAPAQMSAEETARQLANPNTPLASLTLKNQWTHWEGSLPGADGRDSQTFLFQPSFGQDLLQSVDEMLRELRRAGAGRHARQRIVHQRLRRQARVRVAVLSYVFRHIARATPKRILALDPGPESLGGWVCACHELRDRSVAAGNRRGDNLPVLRSEIESVVARFPWVRMAVLGELSAYGSGTDRAEPLAGPTEKDFCRIARMLGIWLVPGSFYVRDGDAVYNLGDQADLPRIGVDRSEGPFAGDVLFYRLTILQFVSETWLKTSSLTNAVPFMYHMSLRPW